MYQNSTVMYVTWNTQKIIEASVPNLFIKVVKEILQISLIETKTESNPNRVKNPKETSIFLNY